MRQLAIKIVIENPYSLTYKCSDTKTFINLSLSNEVNIYKELIVKCVALILMFIQILKYVPFIEGKPDKVYYFKRMTIISFSYH